MGEARKYEHPAGCRRWRVTVVIIENADLQFMK
jgi:hypothetical protein